MRKKIIVSLVTLVTLLLFSCSKNQRVDVVAVNSVKITNISTTGVTLNVEAAIFNGFKQNITLENATLDIKNNNNKLAAITLDKETVLSKNSTSIYNLPLNVRISKIAFSNIRDLILKPTNIEIEGTITGRLGIFRKNVKIKHKLNDENKRQVIELIKKEIGI